MIITSSKSSDDVPTTHAGFQYMKRAEDEILKRAAEKKKNLSSAAMQSGIFLQNCNQLSPPLPLLTFKSLNGKHDSDYPQTVIGNNKFNVESTVCYCWHYTTL